MTAFRKMSAGTLGGQSRVATPPAPSIRVIAQNTAAPTPTPLPEPDPCPSFVGRTSLTLGSFAGPHLTPDGTTLVWAGDGNTVTRHTFPGLVFIESYDPTGGEFLERSAIDDDGSLWWFSDSGNLYRRSNDSSAGVQSLIANVGGAGGMLARSPYDGNFYVSNYALGVPQPIVRVTPAGVQTALTSGPTYPFGSQLFISVAVGESVWYAGSQGLSRYHIPTDTWDVEVASLPDNRALAATGDGRVVYQSTAGAMLSTLDDDLTAGSLDCDDLIVGSGSLLQGGTTVPGDPTRAVMSHYVEYTGEPDGDWIWEFV